MDRVCCSWQNIGMVQAWGQGVGNQHRGRVRAGLSQVCISSGGMVQWAHGHVCRTEHTGHVYTDAFLFFITKYGYAR